MASRCFIRTQKGFSFIELLIIITTIGVIAAIAMSNLNNLKARAFNAGAKNLVKEVVSAVESWIANNPYTNLVSCDNAACQVQYPGFELGSQRQLHLHALVSDEANHRFFVQTCHENGDIVFGWSNHPDYYIARGLSPDVGDIIEATTFAPGGCDATWN
ncbi:MAG TPA: prepilin-type N-terminal cleavage/methylation domain-containing protein [Oligoflexia bacterium]|nr:prepilin-type N-terminal cleavage/methylation domain-containing protein [Oligoflexia bacterium]